MISKIRFPRKLTSDIWEVSTNKPVSHLWGDTEKHNNITNQM